MKRILALILCFSLTSASLQTPEFEEKDTPSIIRAIYIYNFAKQIDWPKEYKQGKFIISVMGGQNLYQELVKKYNSKQIGSQQIEIKKLSNSLNFSRCHVLYVGKEFTHLLPDIRNALKNEATLIIGDGVSAIDKGAAINFIVNNNKLEFELSVNNASKHDLFVGSTLKSLAYNVIN